jgi:hypothetical protein
MLAADATTASVAVRGSAVDAEVAAALTTTVGCWFADVALADPQRVVDALLAEFGAVCDSPCGASAVAPSSATSDCTGSSAGGGAAGCSVGVAAAGGSSGDAVASAEDSLVWVGVASVDAVVSLLDVVEPVCVPPELCTTPGRESAVEARRGEVVELVWVSTELSTFSDVELDEEPAAEVDEVVEEVGSVDDVLAADSDDELDVDDDEPDAELDELVSVGSAIATAGVFATAAPMPSANARTPARTMCCASTGTALWG